MLIGGDDISNDVITLGTCFSVFFRHSQTKGFISNRRLYTPNRKSASKQSIAVLIIFRFCIYVFLIKVRHVIINRISIEAISYWRVYIRWRAYNGTFFSLPVDTSLKQGGGGRRGWGRGLISGLTYKSTPFMILNWKVN